MKILIFFLTILAEYMIIAGEIFWLLQWYNNLSLQTGWKREAYEAWLLISVERRISLKAKEKHSLSTTWQRHWSKNHTSKADNGPTAKAHKTHKGKSHLLILDSLDSLADWKLHHEKIQEQLWPNLG